MFVEVAFPIPIRQEFTYSVPSQLQKEVKIGVQVLAPLGKKTLAGVVTGLLPKSNITTRSILEVNPFGPLLSSRLLELTRWVANYYFCSWGEAIKAALPQGIRLKPQLWVEPIPGLDWSTKDLSQMERELLAFLQSKSRPKLKVSALSGKFKGKEILKVLQQLETKKLVELSYSAQTPLPRARTEQVVRVIETGDPVNLNGKEIEIWKFLKSADWLAVKDLKKTFPKPERLLKKLQSQGLVELEEREVSFDFWQTYPLPEKRNLELSLPQKQVISKIELSLKCRAFSPFLLQGVTGSGKTEIYIRCCEQILQQSRAALILVPEISLTIQTILNFKRVFRDQVVQLHSGLSESQRLNIWRKIKAGQFPIVIGVRSAIFAPLENVGLIIVDEEHDNSYKQSDLAPRYNARDLALVRAKLEKAVVILGSATPSLESYSNALKGKYTLLTLRERVQGKPLPQVEIVDLKAERKAGNYGYLSTKLRQEIEKEVNNKQQVILFLNRRGFSNLIKCQECGYVPICRNCNLTLTYHMQGHWLRCHFCGYQKKAPGACPACNSLKFSYKGAGTQRIESEIKQSFGEDSIRRLDSDLSAKRNYVRNLLLDFQARKFPILLGTQMVTKGYDFPEVTLVGVISADISLELPDFRASEKVFQLLTQVAGRSGRGEKSGQVLIQTYHPLESAIQLASQQDYESFFKKEIALRRELKYPPFCHLIMLLVSGVSLGKVQEQSERLKELLKKIPQKDVFTILGPAPAPLEKVRRKYRYRLMLKTNQVFESLKIIEQIFQAKALLAGREVRVTVDVDPFDLL